MSKQLVTSLVVLTSALFSFGYIVARAEMRRYQRTIDYTAASLYSMDSKLSGKIKFTVKLEKYSSVCNICVRISYIYRPYHASPAGKDLSRINLSVISSQTTLYTPGTLFP